MRLENWLSATALALAVSLTGCGGSTPTAESKPAAPQTDSAAGADTAPQEESPEEVVSQFLDGARRGGAAADVGRLMTTKARETYASIGLVMQPPGSPDATFEVTRSVPYGDGMLVNSIWTEHDEVGQTVTYQVGWALKKEPVGWRVSGLILEDDPQPRVFNFENREDVLAIQQLQQASEQPAALESPAIEPPSSQPPGSQAASSEARTAEAPNFKMPPLR